MPPPPPGDPGGLGGSGFGKDFAEDLDVLLSNTRSWIDSNDFFGNVRNWLEENSSDYFMNTLILVISMWIGVAVLLYIVASFVLKSKNASSSETETKDKVKNNEDESKSENKEATTAVKSEITLSDSEAKVNAEDTEENDEKNQGAKGLQSIANEGRITPPISIGSDFEAVDWVNQCIFKICESPSIRTALTHLWFDALSQYTKSLGIEVILVFICN